MAGVFTPDIVSDKPEIHIPNLPIRDYGAYIRPTDDAAAVALGDKVVEEITNNFIADFERSEEYCQKHGEENIDLMVHVPTFTIIDGTVYMTYYANTSAGGETPTEQEARIAYCSLEDPSDLTVLTVQKVGDLVDGQPIKMVYDTILMHKDDETLYILWTAATEKYYRFYRTFDVKTKTMGPVQVNRFKVGDVTNDFCTTGIINALSANGIGHERFFSDIGIMQKMSTRVENGETYYYSGAYSGLWTAVIKSKDFITWEYVSRPDFDNFSKWENATYVLDDKVYYFVRQEELECFHGFLTVLDLKTGKWEKPVIVRDCQSRSDFIEYDGELYLFHAPRNRDGFGMLKINKDDISKSEVVFVADMKSSLFYAFYKVYGEDVYMAYTVGRKHIRFTKFNLKKFLQK
ncbi:MAG: hypothetical protein E7541_04005 [Ruminococcaceae bacterium]|nr:hypothetical protein [Oscillospiraceae bacterium]